MAGDTRSRRQKVEAMLKGATTEGERAAAQAALDRMKPEPTPQARPTYTQSGSTAEYYARFDADLNDFQEELLRAMREKLIPRCPHGIPRNERCEACRIVQEDKDRYRPPRGAEASPAGRQSRWQDPFEAEYINRTWPQYRSWEEESAARDRLRQAQAAETLRRQGFKMPGDPDFEATFTSSTASANQTFTQASEAINRAQDRRANFVDDFLGGKITANEFRKAMGLGPEKEE